MADTNSNSSDPMRRIGVVNCWSCGFWEIVSYWSSDL